MYKLPLPRNFEHSACNTCTDYFLVEKYFMITKNHIMLHGILEKKTLSVASTFEIIFMRFYQLSIIRILI